MSKAKKEITQLIQQPARSTHKSANAVELANVLHSSLDLEKLLELFSEETSKTVPHDSILFLNDEMEIDYRSGKKETHACSYRLLIAKQKLGEITFSRRSKFSEEETIQLEYMISSLLHPLRNALLYRQAVNSALRDPLTGLNNRSCFEITVKREVNLAHRHHSELALIVMDIDNFKGINDTYGHLVGDCVLRDMGEVARQCVRSTDIIFRYGGEEFVVLLNSTDRSGAYLLAERIRRTMQKKTCTYGNSKINATVSLGVACLRDDESATGLFKRADEAMYLAKSQGKNRTIMADEIEELAT